MAASLTEVDIDDLKARGIRGIILDLDNTITPWRSLEISDGVLAWMKGARAAGMRLCIVSNSSKARRVAELSERLGIPAWARVGGKPFGPGFQQGLTMLGTPPEATAAIGDQLLSDVLGGNRHGLYTVFVAPMSASEFVATKLVRIAERMALWMLRRQGMLPASGRGPAAHGKQPTAGEELGE